MKCSALRANRRKAFQRLEQQLHKLRCTPRPRSMKSGRGEVHSPICGDVSHNQISFFKNIMKKMKTQSRESVATYDVHRLVRRRTKVYLQFLLRLIQKALSSRRMLLLFRRASDRPFFAYRQHPSRARTPWRFPVWQPSGRICLRVLSRSRRFQTG